MVDTRLFIFLITLAVLISLIPNSDAAINLEDMSFLSDDGNLVIDFGKNLITQTPFKTKTVPTLDFGIIKTTGYDFFFDFSDDISVNVYGNSFVIKSFREPVLIYARNMGANNFVVNVYTVDDGFNKQTFTGRLEPISLEPSTTESPEPQTSKELPEMKLLVKHSERVYWQYSYFITARVFDAELNQFNNFDQNWGYLSGINVLVEIFNQDGKLLTSMSGKTGNTGHFEGQYYVASHLAPSGTYTVKITSDNGQSKVTETLSMFVLGQAPRQDTSP